MIPLNQRSKFYTLGALLVVIGLALASQFIRVSTTNDKPGEHTSNSGELTSTEIVGQTFTSHQANLSGIAVKVATYSGRDNTEAVVFHLRDSFTATSDLARVTASPRDFGDNQFYLFKFKPQPDSAGRSYFFFLESPTGRKGNAIAVDLSTGNPYYEGTAFLVRAGDNAPIWPGFIERSGKPTVDVVFRQYHQVPLRDAAIAQIKTSILTFITAWPSRRADYISLGALALPALVIVILAFLLSYRHGENSDKKMPVWLVAALLAALMLAAFFWRWRYAIKMPLTNDEGNYFYDAASILNSRLAGGDGYVKAPLVISWIAIWVKILGHTVVAGRLSSIIISVLTTIPIFFIGREVYNRKTGLLAAALWALAGVTGVFGIYVHTQPVALFFGVSGVAIIWMTLRGRFRSWAENLTSPLTMFFLGGILLGLGVASRKSILALGLLPLMLIMVENKSWRDKLQQLLMVGCGFGVIIAVLLAGANFVYGRQGLWEVIGLNSAEDSVRTIDPAEAEHALEYSIRGMTPFFRESLPLVMLSLIGWGIMIENAFWTAIKELRVPVSQKVQFIYRQILPKLAWILPAAVLWWAWRFFSEYEGALFFDMSGMKLLWLGTAAIGAVVAIWPRYESNVTGLKGRAAQPVKMVIPPNVAVYNLRARPSAAVASRETQAWSAILLPALWIGGLAFFYSQWIKFHANYISEFLPALVVIGGAGAYLCIQRLADLRLWRKYLSTAALVCFGVLMFWSLTLGNYITYNFEHTGTFDLGSVAQAAVWARQHIPITDRIFTGAAVVPFVSGHRTALDIAHPRWYAYDFTRNNPARLNTFLPSAAAMVQAFREARWVLHEQQTGFSFLQEYSEIEAGLARDFQPVYVVENGSNPLTFYQRTR